MQVNIQTLPKVLPLLINPYTYFNWLPRTVTAFVGLYDTVCGHTLTNISGENDMRSTLVLTQLYPAAPLTWCCWLLTVSQNQWWPSPWLIHTEGNWYVPWFKTVYLLLFVGILSPIFQVKMTCEAPQYWLGCANLVISYCSTKRVQLISVSQNQWWPSP